MAGAPVFLLKPNPHNSHLTVGVCTEQKVRKEEGMKSAVPGHMDEATDPRIQNDSDRMPSRERATKAVSFGAAPSKACIDLQAI